jgi:hypothetical protein
VQAIQQLLPLALLPEAAHREVELAYIAYFERVEKSGRSLSA